ncbi:MAG: HlyD family efflux transporter periplasmic adaptor subunit [Burkholderiales bacterium]|nr:HlyD family efflux transporter periplasmic adaptor subunit [Burkholderiales bacterium]
MDEPLFSSRWHRVAKLRPWLQPHIELKRQHQRGVFWYLLIDTTGDRVQRLNRPAYQFVGRCDGRLTVEQIWNELIATMPDAAPTQDEVVQLLIQLHGRGVLQFDVAPDVEAIFRQREIKRSRTRRRGVNPMGFRIALGNPSRIIDAVGRYTGWVFSPWTFGAWLVLMLSAMFLAVLHAGELAAEGAQTLTSPRHLFVMWLTYPAIKVAHELAHGVAVHHWGGRVRQAGVALLLLTPVPFVNASAADGFRHAYQRAVVSAAGIMVELTLAAFALFVWLAVEPGLVRDGAFTVMLIGGVSTVLVNGNPLMRFDGYYLFCDLLDLRNLAGRSARYWQERLSRLMLGIRSAYPIEPVPGERFWLELYSPLSWLYRLAICIGITLWVGSLSTALGILAGVFLVCTLLGKPLLDLVNNLRRMLAREADRSRSCGRLIIVTTVAVLLLTVAPLPFRTVAEGVVWPPEQAQIRCETDGFVVDFDVADGARVAAGDRLVVLDDPKLLAQRTVDANQLAQLDVELFRALQAEPGKAPDLREQLAYAQSQARRTEERLGRLEIHAQTDGVVVLPRQHDTLGTLCRKGDLIGYVMTDAPLTVRVALPQEDAQLVRSSLKRVDVRLAEVGAAPYPAQVQRDMPGAIDRLPSAVLGDRGGGRIVTDGGDQEGLKPRSAVVLMDVAVTALHGDRIGGRALVRFDHGYLPAARQMLRAVRQLLLRHFRPGG